MTKLSLLAVGVIILLAAAGCSQLPPIDHGPPAESHDPRQVCRGAFPDSPWQLYHSISVRMPGGQRAVLTGVTILHPGRGSLRAVLMTLEGLVLFDGEYAERIVVHRAAGPFARPGFARGLLADVGMMLLAPRGESQTAGMDAGQRALCRTALAQGGWLDVIADPETGWVINRYNRHGKQDRQVTGAQGLDTPLARAAALTLIAPGPRGYRLDLKLVDAVPVKPGDNGNSGQ